jgi:hypothetical protein
MKRCIPILSISSHIGISEMGEGEKPPNPMETIVFMKEILSPIFNRNKAEWKF